MARWPTVLPGLTVYQAAAGHDVLVWVTACVIGGGAILFPSLGLLFQLALRGRFGAPEQATSGGPPQPAPDPRRGLLARSAVACLVAGFGLLNVADAEWAHAFGVVFLLCFIAIAFRAIVFGALGATATDE